MSAAGPTHARVPARVGLVGNPSDGYGGAVLAAIADAWAADVTVVPIDHGFRVRNPSMGVVERSSPDAVVSGGRARDAGDHAVAVAALSALCRHRGDRLPSLEVTWTTTIPRSVGLAGSSAIAVAVIEAVAASTGRGLDPRVTAALALEAERVDLGIAAGWQDRIVQAHRSAVLVDAARTATVDGRGVPAVRVLTGFEVDAVVGWLSEQSEDSGAYHAELRRRADDGALAAGMQELAALARDAAECVDRGDADGLRAAVDASWRVRCATAPLRPAHEQLVDAARAAGAVATSPGSGGSVVALPTSRAATAVVIAALETAGARAVGLRLR